MNHSSLEDAVLYAKSVNAAGVGVAKTEEFAIIFYDFAKSAAAGAIGVKRTGLYLPAKSFVESGIMRVDTAVVGTFNLQLLAAGDLVPAQTNPVAGALVNAVRVQNNTIEREILLNVTAVATAGKALFILRLYPY
jgi:hypothetical protein